MASNFTFTDAAEIALAPFVAREQAFDAARTADAEREAARSRGVCQSGMSPKAHKGRSEAEILGAAEAAEASREAYLSSNLGKARARIADGCRKAEQLHARLQDVGSALSRGDGSAIRKAEDAAETLRDLRLLVADMEAFVRLSAACLQIAAE